MELVVKSRNGKISQRQHEYIEEKLRKLERYLDRISKVTVEVSEEQRRNEGTVHRAQVTLVGEHGILLRAEQRNAELIAAVDAVSDTLQRQIQRYKEKHWRRGRLRRPVDTDIGSISETLNGGTDRDDDDDTPRLVRTKEIQVKPMHSDEAVEQMELLGHDFFMFRDAETDQISVVYRRKDGNYGLLVPNVIGK
jgi:ribosomal subunit interface protein